MPARLRSFLQPLEPAFGLRAHVPRRGAAVDRPAFHGFFCGQHAEDRLGDPRLDRLHDFERQLLERQAGLRRLGDDPAGDVVRLAERQLERAREPVGKIGRGGVALGRGLAMRAASGSMSRTMPVMAAIESLSAAKASIAPSLSSCMSF